MEIRGRLTAYGLPGCDSPIVKGSALAALEGKNEEISRQSILALMAAVDSAIPQPDRPKDKPFLMPIEDVFSISGRGTVVTGRVESGIVKVGDEVEIVGIKATQRSEEHTSELQSLMRISYAVFCLKKKTDIIKTNT